MRKSTLRLFSLLVATLLCTAATWAQKALPYNYGFENDDLAAEGWTLQASSSNTGITTASSGSVEGTHLFAFHYSEQSAYLVSPQLSGTQNGVEVSFYYAPYSSYYTESFKVGYSTSETFTDVSSFTFGEEITTTSDDWMLYEESFPAGTKYIAIKYIYNDAYYLLLDDFQFSGASGCAKPANLASSNVLTTSALLTWSGNASQYELVVSDGENANTYIVNNDTTKALTGLTSNTAYAVRLRAICAAGDTSKMISTSFKTPCEDYASLTFSENFDDPAIDEMPDCWNVIKFGSYPYVYRYAYYAHSDTGSLYFYSSSSYNAVEFAILPPFQANLIPQARVQFFYKQASSSANFIVGTMSNPNDTSTFVAIKTLDHTSDYAQAKVDLANAPAGHRFIAIKYVATTSYASAYIDDIEVIPAPSCMEPTNLKVANVTSSGASISWTPRGEEEEWQYLCVGADEEEPSAAAWGSATSVYTNATVISGLAPDSSYIVYLRSYCEDEDDYSAPITAEFTTDCAIYELPYSENFEVNRFSCWIAGNQQSTSSSYIPKRYSGSAHSGSYCLQLNAYISDYTPADSSFAVMPNINFGSAGLGAYTLSFWAKRGSSTYTSNDYYDTLTVGVLLDNNQYVVIDKVGVTDTYAPYEVAFTGFTGNGRVIFLAEVNKALPASYNYGQFYVDDIEFILTPTCRALQDITATNVKRTSMELNFIPKGGEHPSNIQLVYALDSMNIAALEAANKILVQDTNKFLLAGLERDTTYYIYARVNCGNGDYSEWSSLVQKTKGLQGQGEIVVADGTTTSGYAPVYGYNADAVQHTQSIYPEAMLTELVGLTFDQITYSISSASSKTSWRTGEGSFQVGLAITSQANLSSAFATDQLTNIYTGGLDAAGTEMTITLDEPFTYTGGNLLVDFNLPVKTIYESASFYGQTQTGGSRYQYGTNSASTAAFLPRIAFGYSFNLDACPSVTNVTAELLGNGTSAAVVRWTTADADYLSGYNVILSDSVINDFASKQPTYANVQADSIVLNGLTALTEYHVYVQTICQAGGHDEGSSDWAEVSFSTLANCPAIVNLTSQLTDANEVSIAWNTVLETQALNFAYVVSTDSLDEAGLAAAQKVLVNDTLAARIQNLLYEQKYYIYVASACGDAYSSWSKTIITTAPSCAPVLNLSVTRLESNLVVLNWNRSQFGKETQWQAGLLGIDAIPVTTDTTMAMIIGLQPDSTYTAYVKAICGNSDESTNATVQFTTKSMSSCVTIGEGTGSTDYPVTNYDYAYTQMIYTAEEIGSVGNILSIQFDRATYANIMNNMKVYLGLTDKAKFASKADWVAADDLTEVFSGSFETGSQWLELTLNAPFAFNGTKNLVVAVSNGHGVWNSRQTFHYTAKDSSVLVNRKDGDATYANHPGTAEASLISSSRTNMQFCFTPKACPAVKAMNVTDITTNSAKVSWEPSGSETSWNVFLSTTELTDMTDVQFALVSSYVQPLAGLQQFTDYWYYVQPACGGDWNVIKFTTIATCLPPFNFALEAITDSSAVISWKVPEDQTFASFIVAYGLADTFDLEIPTSFQTIQVNDTVVTFTGLKGNTTYMFAVMCNCDDTDQSIWTSPLSFTTECSTFLVDAENPFFEDFEGNLNCWKVINSGTHGWGVSTSYHHSGARSANSGYYGDIYLIVPEITIASEAAAAKLSFWSYNSYTSDYDKNSVVLLIDTIETELWTTASVSASWVESTVDLTPYIGQTISLAFKYEGNNAHGWFVDDVTVKALMPASVTVPASGYTTFFHSENGYALPNEMQAYVFNTTDSLVSVFAGGDTIPANMPLILKAEAGDYNLMPADGGLLPNILNQLVGTDTLLTVANDTNFVFYQLGLNAAQELDSVGFYWLNANGAAGDNFVVPAHKAYLKVGKVEGQPDHYLFNASGASTGIFDIIGSDKAVKFFHNGHFYILHQGVIFDATGRKVDNIQ